MRTQPLLLLITNTCTLAVEIQSYVQKNRYHISYSYPDQALQLSYKGEGQMLQIISPLNNK